MALSNIAIIDMDVPTAVCVYCCAYTLEINATIPEAWTCISRLHFRAGPPGRPWQLTYCVTDDDAAAIFQVPVVAGLCLVCVARFHNLFARHQRAAASP